MRRAYGCAFALVVVAAVAGVAIGIGRQKGVGGLRDLLDHGSSPPEAAYNDSGRDEPNASEHEVPQRGPGAPAEAPGKSGTRDVAAGVGRAAIIIDDVGYSHQAIAPFLKIDADLTFSILPSSPLATEVAQSLDSAGRCVMLHLPMQPRDDAEPLEPDTISADTSDDDIGAIVAEALARVPCAAGVNNHMGSRATADRRVMDAVMRSVRSRGLFFIDSRTTAASVAVDAADAAGVPALARDVFLDSAGQQDAASVAANMEALADVAARRGVAIGIGHPRSETAEGIRMGLQAFRDAGVQIVSACSLF